MAPRRRNEVSLLSAPPRPERSPFEDPFATALLEVVSERGFEGTTVEGVSACAGASEEEFHSRFTDLEDCAIQVFEAFIADFQWRVGSAYLTFGDWRSGLRAAAYTAADYITENPKLLQFGVVEVLKAKNEMLRVRREEVLMYGAGLIEEGRYAAPDPEAVPDAAGLMAIGSIVQLMTHRLQVGVELAAIETTPQMLYLATRPYIGERLAREELTMPRPEVPEPRPLRAPARMTRMARTSPSPPDRPRRDPFEDPVATGLVEVVYERGYEHTTSQAVIDAAGVTREEFEERFRDLEDCVRQTYDAFIEDFRWRVGSAYFAFEDWRTALRAAAYAAADGIAEFPKLIRFAVVEVLKAEDEMLRVRREEVVIYCGRLIDGGRQEAADPDSIPDAAPLMAIGSIVQLMTHRLQSGVDLDPYTMVPQLLYMATRPYLGDELAREELTLPRPSPPKSSGY